MVLENFALEKFVIGENALEKVRTISFLPHTRAKWYATILLNKNLLEIFEELK